MLKRTYRNPLGIQNIGDPYILKTSNGMYYCYPTSSNQGFKAWSSKNLIDWKAEGLVYDIHANEKAWGYRQFWAPEVVERDGKFYMYYTARWKEKDSLRIGIALADSPTGQFHDRFDRPMFDFGYAAIDATVFADDDGRRYLYYSRDCSENEVNGIRESHIYGFELSDNMLEPKGEGVLLLQPDQPWEFKSGNRERWNEGPVMLKHNGLYYLMYSANFYRTRDYSIGYAVSRNPLGPFEKYPHNPVLFSNSEDISGPGHHSVTESPDGSELWIVYHIHTNAKEGGGNRQVCIDRMAFREDGSIVVYGPTNTEHPAPSM